MFMDNESPSYVGAVGGMASVPQAWKPDLLSSFAFLMAGHGRSVSVAMMLGDPGYAQVQLAIARSLDDELLRCIVQEMNDAVACSGQSTATGWSPAHRFSIPFRTRPPAPGA